MTQKFYYILSASLVLAGLFLNTAELKAQSDTFDGTVIDPLNWEVSAPLGNSTVTQNGALFLTSDGTFGAFCNTPGLFGPGAGIALRKKLSGDFDIQVDFSGFSGPNQDFVQAFFNVYQDQNNQLHIKRIRGNSIDGTQTVSLVGGLINNGLVTPNPVSSGTFRITRSGSVMTTFFNGAPEFSISAFGSPVIVSLVLLGPGGQTASVEFDNFSINSGTLVDPLLVCPSELTSLSPATLWIGLKNSDAVGLRLDLQAEVFLSETKVGEGALNNVASGSSGFNNAKLNAIPLTLFAPVEVPANAELEITLSVRRTCSGGGHNSGTPRLWYNGQPIDSGSQRDAGTRFGATIANTTSEFFLRDGFALSTTAGTAKKFVDVPVDNKTPCPNRPFTPFGTWGLTLP